MSGRGWYHHLGADSGVAEARLAVSALVFPAGSAWDSAAANRPSILRSKAVSWRSMTEAVCSPLTMPDDGLVGRRRLAGARAHFAKSRKAWARSELGSSGSGLEGAGGSILWLIGYRYWNKEGTISSWAGSWTSSGLPVAIRLGQVPEGVEEKKKERRKKKPMR